MVKYILYSIIIIGLSLIERITFFKFGKWSKKINAQNWLEKQQSYIKVYIIIIERTPAISILGRGKMPAFLFLFTASDPIQFYVCIVNVKQ